MDPIEVVEKITMFIGILSFITTMTPNKSDDVILQKILDILNILGMNIGKAKNK